MTEPRALTAALQSPAFVTRGAGAAMHAANRHVERWAPEEGASRIRPLRNLSFVDRLVSPWLESAQRSTSLRMFSQYIASGPTERATPSTPSWVLPRPWYQDELDWMAAARQVGAQTAMEQSSAPSLLTTRGTYVAPTQPRSVALPSALHEYIAPSLSVARPDVGTLGRGDAYSPLVPFAAAQAAHVMARAVRPMTTATTALSPGLRAVLTTMLERATRSQEVGPTRASQSAPELVTPPAPRLPAAPADADESPATQVADRYAEQYARVAELQRMARSAAEREAALRQAQTVTAPVPAADSRIADIRAAEARAVEQRQAELQRRLGDAAARRQADTSASDAAAAAAERQRIEERIAQRLQAMRQQESGRLHEQSRDAAARDARSAAIATPDVPRASEARAVEAPRESRVAAEIAAAVAALPPELASMVTANIGQRPERAVQAIAELGEALRSIELIARSSAAGGSFETTRGPRVVMPAGLGGLVSTVERTTGERAQPRMPMMTAPIAVAPAHAEQRMPALTFLRAASAAPTSALGAATSTTPAALGHVAWSDRWLARFAGARPQSLDVLAMSASPDSRMQMLASSAPASVFVAPIADDRSAAAEPSDEPLPTLRGGHAPEQPVVRFADDAETPDDMFAAIAMAATRSRASAAVASVKSAQPAPSLPAADPDRYTPRETLADLVAHAAPSAPGAGFAAGLASSPFAPALRHVITLGSAPSFDVRALFGAGLSATYLAGLLSSSNQEISIAAPMLPTWATWGDGIAPLAPTTREVGELDLPLVAPEQLRAAEAEAFGDDHATAPLTTLRSALLSFDGDALAGAPRADMRVSATSVRGAPLARTMIDSLTQPMFADTGLRDASDYLTTYAAPGMVGERAQSWSVAQERSSSDLAFDFVTPELVLAARVYGLGAAEAAQAARLAIAGPGQLTAMAGAVDRTFVQAMAIDAERRSERARAVSAYPIAAGDLAHASVATRADATDGPSTFDAARALTATTFTASTSSFGVERRLPRGSFLWPAATTAALGLHAPAPDGDHNMSVAALELLAAQAVAELGTYAALSDVDGSVGRSGASGASGAGSVPVGSVASGGVGATEPRDEDVLATASALVPSARRDKFEALYVALGQSPSGRTWSPAARAARALALAGRGEESVSARERATVAWDVLPVVYGMAEATEEPLSTGEAAMRTLRRRDELRALDPMFVDARPGLAGLSSRAGEALGSYVTPTPAASSSVSAASSSSSAQDVGAVLRAPTAAPELVQTGRGGRYGGGEVEIPSWFEAAARKMFEDRSGASSMADGISIAELTLVAAAPSQQIAASTRVAGATAAPSPAPAAAEDPQQAQVDVEKLANDVYREVLVLMDIARSRNGEPYL